MPTFELTAILTAAVAVATGITGACESATSLVETEFAKVPSEPPAGCLTDVLAQEGMCALVSQARLGCQHRFVSGVIVRLRTLPILYSRVSMLSSLTPLSAHSRRLVADSYPGPYPNLNNCRWPASTTAARVRRSCLVSSRCGLCALHAHAHAHSARRHTPALRRVTCPGVVHRPSSRLGGLWQSRYSLLLPRLRRCAECCHTTSSSCSNLS